MTVVSQKRDFVFDFDSHVIAQRGEYIYLHIDGRDVEIGKYESHERAQEVLKADRIIFKFCNNRTRKQSTNSWVYFSFLAYWF